MENKVKENRRKPQPKSETTTEAGSPVMFVTIEEHTKMIDEKTSQLISLENGLRAIESEVEKLKATNSDLRNGNDKLRRSLTNENIIAAGYLNKLSKIPNWIKKIFDAA
jgi:predicted RNase H-like nuclease (RuvC/YqgF family)